MEPQPEVLSFVKALASADRLRIVGLLSQGAKRAVEIASVLGIHASEANRHLEQLTASGVVSEADGVYDLNEKAIESSSADTMRPRIPAVDRLSPSIILPERVVSPCENTPSPNP